MASIAESLKVTENMLTAYPDLDGIFCSNESGTAGAVQALKARRGKAKLVGFDFSPMLLDELQAGFIDSLVVQDPFKMGETAVVTAVRAIRGRKLQRTCFFLLASSMQQIFTILKFRPGASRFKEIPEFTRLLVPIVGDY